MTDSEFPGDSPLLRAIHSLGRGPAVGASPAVRFAAGAGRDPNGGASDLAAMAEAAEREDSAAAPVPIERPDTLPEPVDTVGTIAAAIAAGAPPGEQLERALGRAARLDGDLNAFVWLDGARAQAAAGRLAGRRDLPLAGVPIAHKDILWTADAPTTAGSDLLGRYTPPRDARVVRRLAAAGAISLGKLNTHEFATGITGLVSAHGPTVNPRDPARVPGGSSCGSAAAVAAGIVAAATATDTGGSIRIPAACCGVVGFKPTFGAVPVDGVIPFAWSLDHVGVIASDVVGAARVYAAMADDPDPRSDRYDLTRNDDDAIAFAVAEDWLARCDVATANAIERLAGALVDAGAERRTVSTPAPGTMAPIAGAIFLAEGGALHAATLERAPERYRPETRDFLAQARGVTAVDYVHAQRCRAVLRDEFVRLHHRVDLLICPALPTPAPRVGQREVELPDGSVDVRAALTLFTRPFNLTGQPVVCLPIATAPDGLPIAVQLVGAPGADRALLGRARWIEERVGG